MAIGTYTSIITLNVNGLNSPTKRQRLTEWIQNKTHIYAVYKKHTSNLKTHMRGWKKNLLCKWEAKENWSSNPRIRQNRP